VGEALDAFLPDVVSLPLSVVTSLFTRPGRSDWGVRVFDERTRFRAARLVYGEEYDDFADSVERAREIVWGLVAVGRSWLKGGLA
jgi:hypothetical protein